METKPRILYLQKILLERTDEENPLSTTQLINILNDEYGISVSIFNEHKQRLRKYKNTSTPTKHYLLIGEQIYPRSNDRLI